MARINFSDKIIERRVWLWPIKFFYGSNFNSPSQFNFRTDGSDGGVIVNYVRKIYGVCIGELFIGCVVTQCGPRPCVWAGDDE